MIHRECTELLHYLADVPKADGLCLITTRYPLKNLTEWHERSYKNLSLIDLSIPDSLLMLRRRGVKGSEEDMIEVINRYKGHALSLTSVAGYVNRYHDGDIKQAPEVEFILSDRERFKDVNKLLRKYAEKMSDAERIFLHIFSLFRQEVTENDFAIAFRHRVKGTEFNKVLVRMHELDFRDLISGLVDWQLISYDKTKKTYTSHPLIKGYFESDFDEKNKKLCHRHLYQYFSLYTPVWPETLEEMQPLFEQVYHGCAAGLYDEVLDDVYWAKIYRRKEFFIYHKPGGWEINLSLARTFFPEGDLSQKPFVTKTSSQGWLLNEAGLALLFTGRPKEAEIHLQNALEIAREVGVPYLEIEALLESGRLHLDMGRHKDAIRDANEVLKMCTRTGFKFYEPEAEIVLSKAYLALNDLEQAKTFAQSAYEKAVGMNYRWPEGDAAHLLGEIYLAVGDKDKAREWLERAVACRKEILDPEVKESEMVLKGL
jgi:tetratricopeptide (TPR) repeat protein